jgi:hypothetical protein
MLCSANHILLCHFDVSLSEYVVATRRTHLVAAALVIDALVITCRIHWCRVLNLQHFMPDRSP